LIITGVAKTGIFPINHAMVLRRSLFEKHPWAALSIYQAMLEANEIANRELTDRLLALCGRDESAVQFCWRGAQGEVDLDRTHRLLAQGGDERVDRLAGDLQPLLDADALRLELLHGVLHTGLQVAVHHAVGCR